MKRYILFLLTNVAIIAVLGLMASAFGLRAWMGVDGAQGFTSLLLYCSLFGFGGAGLSLLFSRPLAKWSTGARVLTGTEGALEAWLVSTVARLAAEAGIQTPEVALYQGTPNAFATGRSKSASLVAVSTGLLAHMDKRSVEAVLAHEVAHIANGDMVTMTLLQGTLNTLVMVASRLIARVIQKAVGGDSERTSWTAVIEFVLDLVLGLPAMLLVAWFSRRREYRADAGAAKLLGGPAAMVEALKALEQAPIDPLKNSIAAFGITSKGWSLFATHPPIQARIQALQTN